MYIPHEQKVCISDFYEICSFVSTSVCCSNVKRFFTVKSETNAIQFGIEMDSVQNIKI